MKLHERVDCPIGIVLISYYFFLLRGYPQPRRYKIELSKVTEECTSRAIFCHLTYSYLREGFTSFSDLQEFAVQFYILLLDGTDNNRNRNMNCFMWSVMTWTRPKMMPPTKSKVWHALNSEGRHST